MSMIVPGGTFKARESCDRTKSMIVLGGTLNTPESSDQSA
jgi:hypothetical protein